MQHYRLVLTGLALAALAVGLGVRLLRDDERAATVSAAPPAPARPAQGPLAGTASCAGRNCHGGLEPSSRAAHVLLDEYTTWVSRDPHARAYAVLLEPRSQAMARHLGIAAAHESERCLACHTSPAAAHLPDDPAIAVLVRQERSAGVGCEACHGNASGWIDAHVGAAWDQADKPLRGMVPVGDPATLARQCAGCHVGAPPSAQAPAARDVNHDLLAAGHPRLAFEFSAFFANLPAHWKPKPLPEGRRWAAGQLAAAEAALELLEHRAASADAPWPELAEYDCFGCHHSLTEPSWRQEPTPRRKRLGALAWGTWYFSMPPALANDALPELDELEVLMEKLRPRTAVHAQAEPALAELRKLKVLDGWHDKPDFARTKMNALLADTRLARLSTWDGAEQTYLALQALNRVAKNAALQSRLDALLEARAFRAGMDSPLSLPRGGFVPAGFLR